MSNKASAVVILACLMIAGVTTASSATIVYGSADDGNCYPFNCNDSGSASGQAIEYQQVYDGSQFSGPVNITSLTFFDEFLPGFGFSNVPLLAGTYQFSFAVTNKAVNGLSTNLASNITSGQATFLSLTTAGVPAGFSSLTFNGTTPYAFNPASGNLLLDIIVTNQANVSSASYSPANGFDSDDSGTSTSRAFKIGGQSAVADSTGLVTQISFNAVPEPGTWALLGGGLVFLFLKKGSMTSMIRLKIGVAGLAAVGAMGISSNAVAQPIQQRTIAIPLHAPAGSAAFTANTGSIGVTVPTWSQTFNINSTSYPQTFVGTNPATTNVTTNIIVPVVPVVIVLNNGAGPRFDPTKKLNTAPAGSALSALLGTVTSPLFQNAIYTTGGTTVGTGVQFGDAIQRATWWNSVSTTSPNWHTHLTYQIQPTITLNVPVGSGSVNGAFAIVDINWLGPQLDGLAPNYGAANFPLFLLYQVLQTDNGNCCILGYHTALQIGLNIQTYGTGTYLDPGQLSNGVADVSVLSHEISEWLNDPFVNNPVPDWPAPFSFIPPGPPYTAGQCQNNLETGDPIEDRDNPAAVVFHITTVGRQYTLQNEALAPWFVHASPSFSVNGWYTYLGPIDSEFASFAPACPQP